MVSNAGRAGIADALARHGDDGFCTLQRMICFNLLQSASSDGRQPHHRDVIKTSSKGAILHSSNLVLSEMDLSQEALPKLAVGKYSSTNINAAERLSAAPIAHHALHILAQQFKLASQLAPLLLSHDAVSLEARFIARDVALPVFESARFNPTDAPGAHALLDPVANLGLDVVYAGRPVGLWPAPGIAHLALDFSVQVIQILPEHLSLARRGDAIGLDPAFTDLNFALTPEQVLRLGRRDRARTQTLLYARAYVLLDAIDGGGMRALRHRRRDADGGKQGGHQQRCSSRFHVIPFFIKQQLWMRGVAM
jgi:hypothetical protein